MSEAKLKQLEGDNRVLREQVDQFIRLKKVVRRIYTAGFWSCDRIDDAQAKDLFTRLRDAAGITPGNSPVPVGVREGA